MRKAVALVLCAVMLLSLCACGKSKAVKSVEKSIASIGEVTLDSEAQITDARKAYDALSKEEKEGVENYSTLKEAEAQLKKIKPIKLTTELNLSLSMQRRITSDILSFVSGWNPLETFIIIVSENSEKL